MRQFSRGGLQGCPAGRPPATRVTWVERLAGRSLENVTFAGYLAELHDQGWVPASDCSTVAAACFPGPPRRRPESGRGTNGRGARGLPVDRRRSRRRAGAAVRGADLGPRSSPLATCPRRRSRQRRRCARRVGLASELTSRGAPIPDVMLAGNWKAGGTVAHYSAGATAERGAAARPGEPLPAGRPASNWRGSGRAPGTASPDIQRPGSSWVRGASGSVHPARVPAIAVGRPVGVVGISAIMGAIMAIVTGKYRGTTTYFRVFEELVRAAQYRGLTTYQDIAVLNGLTPVW